MRHKTRQDLVCNEVANTKYDLPEGKIGMDEEKRNIVFRVKPKRRSLEV